MPDQSSISSIHNNEIQSLQQKTSQSKAIEKDLQNKCQDCLKSSINTQNGTKQLDKNQAIQKLDLLKESTNNENLKNKINSLINQLDTANLKELLTSAQQKSLIEFSFQKIDPIQASQNLAKHADIISQENKNPFKTTDPFAPKIVTSIHKTESSNTQLSKTNPPKKQSLFENIISFFKKYS